MSPFRNRARHTANPVKERLQLTRRCFTRDWVDFVRNFTYQRNEASQESQLRSCLVIKIGLNLCRFLLDRRFGQADNKEAFARLYRISQFLPVSFDEFEGSDCKRASFSRDAQGRFGSSKAGRGLNVRNGLLAEGNIGKTVVCFAIPNNVRAREKRQIFSLLFFCAGNIRI